MLPSKMAINQPTKEKKKKKQNMRLAAPRFEEHETEKAGQGNDHAY